MQNSMQSLRMLPPKHRLALALKERARRKLTSSTLDQQQKERLSRGAKGNHKVIYTSVIDIYGHPFSDLLKPFRYKIFYGGRGAAKSWSFAEALIRKTNEQCLRVLCTREFQSSINESVYTILADTIKRLGLSNRFTVGARSIYNHVIGSDFIFAGLRHNVDEIKSTEGVDIVWVAEAQNTSENSWSVLIPTIRKRGSEVWVEFNVTDEDAPTYRRFVTHTPPNSIKHQVNYTENPYFDQTELRAEMEYDKEVDYEAYENVWLGVPRRISKSIIFAGKYVEEAFPDDLYLKALYEHGPRDPGRLFYGADFGFAQDPATLIRFFILDDNLYVSHEAYGIHVELNEMADFYEGNKIPTSRYCEGVPGCREWPIKADNSRPETISHIRGLGFNIEAAEKWPGCVEDGIAHIRKFRQIVIHPRCKYTLAEARLYSYKKDKNTGEVLPIVVDKHNHCWDAVRYGLDGYIQRSGEMGQGQSFINNVDDFMSQLGAK